MGINELDKNKITKSDKILLVTALSLGLYVSWSIWGNILSNYMVNLF